MRGQKQGHLKIGEDPHVAVRNCDDMTLRWRRGQTIAGGEVINRSDPAESSASVSHTFSLGAKVDFCKLDNGDISGEVRTKLVRLLENMSDCFSKKSLTI